MKMHRNMKVSVFHKLFFVFLAVIVTFYGVSLYANIQGAKHLEQEVSRSTLDNIRFFSRTLEGDILRINEAKKQFINDYELQKLSIAANTMTDYQKIHLIQNLQHRLIELKMSSSYISNIDVHIPILNRTICSDSSISNLQPEKYVSVFKAFNNDKGLIISKDGELYLNLAYPYGEYTEKGSRLPLYIVTIKLSKDKLYQQLFDVFSSTEGGTVLFENRGSWALATDFEMWNELKDFFIHPDIIKPTDEKIVNKIRVNNEELWLMGSYSNYLGIYFFTYIPTRIVLRSYTHFRHWVWYLSVFSILMVLLYNFWIRRLFAVPLNKFVIAFKEVEEGNLDFCIQHRSNDEFRYLYGQFNIMIDKLKDYIQQIYIQQIQMQHAELKQLQYHIKPHFLYNSIFLIYRMAKDNECENIERFSLHLGNYYKFITRNKSDEILFIDEIEHARAYVEIQSIRFANRILVSFGDIPPGLEEFRIPFLIVQPLIENAYQHGLKSVERDGKISVRINTERNFLHITIEDNGIGMQEKKLCDLQKKLNHDKSSQQLTTGLVNVHQRLRIKYGSGSGIRISQGAMGGTCVIIDINMGRQ